MADGHPDGFCKLIADRPSHAILGAHVLGEYSAETVQVVATAMSAGMSVEQLAEMQFAYPTFTEAVSMAAQKVCRDHRHRAVPARLELPRPPGMSRRKSVAGGIVVPVQCVAVGRQVREVGAEDHNPHPERFRGYSLTRTIGSPWPVAGVPAAAEPSSERARASPGLRCYVPSDG